MAIQISISTPVIVHRTRLPNLDERHVKEFSGCHYVMELDTVQAAQVSRLDHMSATVPQWTRDLYISDNLPVLRTLANDSVDLIYLDPPFNSKKAYRAPIGSQAEGQMFDDTWRWDDLDPAWLGEIDRHCPQLAMVIETVRSIRGNGDAAYCAMMGVRLIQLHRVLKPHGSIYLHCDDAATHMLRLCMDAIFKKSGFRNEIIWRRYGAHNDARRYGRVHDVLHFYQKRRNCTWNGAWLPLNEAYVESAYRHTDARGTYRTAPLHTGGLSGAGYEYEFLGHTRTWKYPEERMKEMHKDNLIRQGRKSVFD